MRRAWLLLLLTALSAGASTKQGPLVIHNINVFNQHAVHMNGIGPWTSRFSMSIPEGSPCCGSRLSMKLDNDQLRLRHFGEAFVGIFRDGKHVESLYPPGKILAATEDHLPFGKKDNERETVAVQEDTILFLVLPHVKGWSMRLVDLIGAIQSVDTSSPEAFNDWAHGLLYQCIKDNRATIVAASIGRKGVAASTHG